MGFNVELAESFNIYLNISPRYSNGSAQGKRNLPPGWELNRQPSHKASRERGVCIKYLFLSGQMAMKDV